MEFDLSEEQRLLDETLRSLLSDRMPLDTLRPMADAGEGFDADFWGTLQGMGLAGLMVPEVHGGAGLAALDAAVAAEALGYAAAPAPFAGPVVMAPLALRMSADTAEQATWLPKIASGKARVAVAFAGHSGQTGGTDVSLKGDHLSGRLDGVMDVGGATHVLVYLPDGRAALAALQDDKVTVDLQRSLDRTRGIADLTFAGAQSTVLEAANDAEAAARAVLAAGRVMLAADTLGAARCMLDKAVAYAGERVQFKRVIASFQAVKHMCAEMAAALEPCRALVWYGAHAQDALPDEALVAACHAKAHLSEVGRDIARTATEVHGGMGFTDLMGLHFWFKRIAFNRHMLGGPEQCRHEAAIAQGWIAE